MNGTQYFIVTRGGQIIPIDDCVLTTLTDLEYEDLERVPRDERVHRVAEAEWYELS